MTSVIRCNAEGGAYDIHVGHDALQAIPAVLSALVPKHRVAIISDTNVWTLHGDKLLQSLARGGYDTAAVLHYCVVPGEQSKCRAVKAAIEDWMLAATFTRDTVVLAFGGGVVGDLAGFVASTYMRGVPFVQVPTSLLAMVDASIGGKTGIDTPAGKNLIGTFHQPLAVIADLSLLATLPQRHYVNGVAEIIKLGAVIDAALFDCLESQFDAVLDRVDSVILPVIATAMSTKAHIVSNDTKEAGTRMLLNFGHTIGHAVEALQDGHMLHGEAVAIGMIKEAQLARAAGLCSTHNVERLAACIELYELPTQLPPHLAVDDLMAKMAVDKKSRAGTIKCVMMTDIGHNAGVQGIPEPLWRRILSPWLAVIPTPLSTQPQVTSLLVPGSKSLSNRALLLAAMATGTCALRGLLLAEDTMVMMHALGRLGAAFKWTKAEDGENILLVQGTAGRWKHPGSQPLQMCNSGTSARFLTVAVAMVSAQDVATHGPVILAGSKRMHERPAGPLVDALIAQGVRVEYLGLPGCLPLAIYGGGLAGGAVTMASSQSSQFVSAMLLCGPFTRAPLHLTLDQAVPTSLPYIEMTLLCMKDFGVDLSAATCRPAVNQFVFPPSTSGYSCAAYCIEPDASSASYALGIAAVRGDKVTIKGLGTQLQGDAGFYRVMEQMGCTVTADASGITVQGPPPGRLRAISINMADLTDTFMTLAAVAVAADGVTQIRGVANQRVKECNRILAIATELQRCGVRVTEVEDGIDVYGIGTERLNSNVLVECYEDHRIAMACSILGCMPQHGDGVIISKPAVTSKTYPSYWDDLKTLQAAHLIGRQPSDVVPESRRPRMADNASVIIIGMRAAGKSFLGAAAAGHVGYAFLDLDALLQQQQGKSCADIIATIGWDGFRSLESDLLQHVLQSHPTGTIISCGGGIVESATARNLLAAWTPVVTITRDIADIEHDLHAAATDTQRPAYAGGQSIAQVYDRRQPWLQAAATHEFIIRAGDHDWSAIAVDFLVFMQGAGLIPPNRTLPLGDGTFFVCLTCKQVQDLSDSLPTIVEGSDAVELRVDLLASCDRAFVSEQVALLRRHVGSLPIIFTVRTAAHGGAFKGTPQELLDLWKLGIRLGCQFVDVEFAPGDSRTVQQLQHSLEAPTFHGLIMSHHIVGKPCPAFDDLLALFRLGACGRPAVVKIVAPALTVADSLTMASAVDAARAQLSAEFAVLGVCTGASGTLSRVLNRTMTPVTHPALPVAAAPGQLSVQQLQAMRSQLGLLPAKHFFIFGHPVAMSPSPALHNTAFQHFQLPYDYQRHDTSGLAISQIVELLKHPATGGASITIPHKEELVPFVDELSVSAKEIGAINTITHVGGGKLVADNTDWIGIYDCVRALRPSVRGHALIIGAGGTARAAAYAAKQLGLELMFFNRTASKADSLVETFGGQAIESMQLAASDRLALVVSTVPAAAETLLPDAILATKPIVVDVAYQPTATALVQQAVAAGCGVVQGIDMLISQGLQQSRIWTHKNPPVIKMNAAARAFLASLTQ